MDNYEFADRIIEYRKANGLSQKDLGEMLGVSNKAVSKWENGESMPKMSTLLKLAEMTGIDGNELIGIQNDKDDSSQLCQNPELDKLKTENAALSLQLESVNKKRRKSFVIALVLCAIGIVVFALSSFLFSGDSKINSSVKDAGEEKTKIVFSHHTFVAPDKYQKYVLDSYNPNLDSVVQDEKYADYYDKNGNKSKVLIKCSSTLDFVLLEVGKKDYWYASKKIGLKNISYKNVSSIELLNQTIAAPNEDGYTTGGKTFDKYNDSYIESRFIELFCEFYQNKGASVDSKITERYLGKKSSAVVVNFEIDSSNAEPFIELGEFFVDDKSNVYFYDYVTASSYTVGKELSEYVI